MGIYDLMITHILPTDRLQLSAYYEFSSQCQLLSEAQSFSTYMHGIQLSLFRDEGVFFVFARLGEYAYRGS